MTQKVMKKLKEHDDLFGKIDRRFDQVDQRFDQVDQRFDQVDQRFEQVDQRFDKVERITQEALELGHKNAILFEAHEDKLDRVLEVVLHTQARLDARDDLEEKFQNHEHRISAIESTIKGP